MKASHANKEVVEDFVTRWVKQKYGKEREVTVNREKEHSYLGMTIRYEEDGSVVIDMIDYVEDMLDEFPVQLKGTISTPANDSIFKVVESKPLSKQRSEVFHLHAAKEEH